MSDFLDALKKVEQEDRVVKAQATRDLLGTYVDANKDFLDAFDARNRVEVDGEELRFNVAMAVAKTANADKEPAVREYAKRKRLPRAFVRQLDNADLTDMIDKNGLHAGLKAWLSSDVSNAIVARGSLEELDRVFRFVDSAFATERAAREEDVFWSNATLDERKKHFTEGLRRGRYKYSPEMLEDLKNRGFVRDVTDPGYFRKTGYVAPHTPGGEYYPTVDEWFMNPEELAARRREIGDANRLAIRRAYEQKYGNARWGKLGYRLDADNRADQEEFLRVRMADIAAMQALSGKYGEVWREWDNDRLQEAIDDLSRRNNGVFDVVSATRLQEVDAREGLGEAADTLTDFYGVKSLLELGDAWWNDTAGAVERFAKGEPLKGDDLNRVGLSLELLARELRGSTWGAEAEEMLATSLRMVGEIYLATVASAGAGTAVAPGPGTGAFAAAGFAGGTTASVRNQLARNAALQTAKTTISSVLKNSLTSQALRNIAKGSAKLMPYYIPKVTADTIRKSQSTLSPMAVDGRLVLAEIPPETESVAAAAFNAALDQYTEVFSERLGDLIPSVPGKVKSAIWAKTLHKLGLEWTPNKATKVLSEITKRGAWNGLVAEYGEEKAGQAIRAFASNLAQLTGTEYGDLGQYETFGSPKEEALLMSHLLVTSGVMGAPATFSGIRRAVKTSRDFEAHMELHNRVQAAPLYRKDPEAMGDMLRTTKFGSVAAMTTEDARGLFQSSPEVLDALGITEERIGAAEAGGTFLLFSIADAHAKLDGAQFQQVLSVSMTDLSNGATMKDVESTDLSEEAYEKEVVRRQQEAAGIEGALNAKFRELVALGRPADETRAVLEILGQMAHYHSRYGGRSGVDWLNGVDINKMSEAKWQTLSNWNANRAREKAILDRLIAEEIPEVAETAETAESFALTEEQAEHWQPIVQQRAEAYVSKRANTLKGADAEAFYDAGIDAVARAIATYEGDSKGLDAYIGRAISNAFNTTATKLGKNPTASLDESIGEEGGQTRGDTIQSKELSPEDAAIMKNAKARLAAWLQSLSDIDRKIIALWKAVKNLRGVSAAVGKSHEFVRQRLAKLQAEARKAMEVSGEFQTSAQLFERYGDSWLKPKKSGGHSTQIAGTVSTYRNIGERLKEIGFRGRILDASSGKGLGTKALREMGFDVDDVEPFPEEGYKPKYTSYDDLPGGYDLIISNAVLNVIPEDWRNDILHKMADNLAPGGQMIINVRGADVKTAKYKDTLDDPLEVMVKDPKTGEAVSYQKGFTVKELSAYIERELGSGYVVSKATADNSGVKSGVPVIVTKRSVAPQYQDEQKFGGGRHKLPVEKGRPLLTLPGNRPKTLGELTAKNPSFVAFLGEVYNNLPNSVEDPMGKTIYLKMGEGKDNRLVHYITEAPEIIATTSDEKPKRENVKYEKIPWIPRIAETVQNAQVILQDNEGDQNFAYVRRYPEGWHVVVATANGVFVGHREYDRGAITQFAETSTTSRRDNFTVKYKRRPWFQGAPSTATATPDVWFSSADGSTPSSGSPSAYGRNNIYPSLEFVKSLYEKNDEISHRGVTWQDPVSLKTIITLFEKADSSTLIHEIAHYCFNSMEEAIRLGVADQRMIDDFNTLKKWAESNPESMIDSAIRKLREESEDAPRNYKKFFDRLEKDEKKTKAELLALVQAMNEGTQTDRKLTRSERFILQYVATEQKEKLARGFEAFVREGKAPTPELSGAFATMKRLLHWVYKAVEALGVQINDEVRGVFNGILATESTVEQDSLVAETVRELEAQLEGMTLEEKEAFLKLAENSKDQAVQELQARKAKELEELKPAWRAEANAEMADDKTYRAWRAIQKDGLLDFATVVELIGEEKAKILRDRGLTSNSGKKGKNGEYSKAEAGVQPAKYAADFDFGTMEEMLDALLNITPPAQFIENYISAKTAEYHHRAELDEAELSTAATLDFFDRVQDALSRKLEREDRAVSRARLREAAAEEIRTMSVRDILKGNDSTGRGKVVPAECRKHLRDLTTAVSKGDYITAFEAAKNLRYRLEVLRQVGHFRKRVQQAERRIKQARTAKKGVMDGAFQHAIQDLALRFGFTAAKPIVAYDPNGEVVSGVPPEDTFAKVLERFNTGREAEGLQKLVASDKFLTQSGNYRDLMFTEFDELANIIEFLNGEGRAIVSESRRNLALAVEKQTEELLEQLNQQERKYYAEKGGVVGWARSGWRAIVATGSKLRNLMKFADAKGGTAFARWYDELNLASSRQLQILGPYQRRLKAAIAALRQKVDMEGLPEFPPDVVAQWKKDPWSRDKLIMCALNMGNTKNRQRLMDGYGWTEEDLNNIASRFTPEMWDNIQEIWDVINDPHLTRLLREEFRKENHFDMKMEAPMSFTVTCSDGTVKEMKGGYFPLDYLFHRNPVVNDKANLDPQLPPAFRKPSFGFERVEVVTDPLSLNASLIHTHLFDVTHYITHREVMRKAMRVMGNHEFETAFAQTQSFERWKEFELLMKTMADPSQSFAAMNAEGAKWYRYIKGVLTGTALWASPETMAMQLSSVTLGWDELGGQFLADAYNPANFMANLERAQSMSGFMRERMNLKDLDVRAKIADLTDTEVQRILRGVKAAGFKPMQWLDMAVAVPAWNAAFNKAKAEGKSDMLAVAYADEFVAKTQGGARVIDLSTAQMGKARPILATFAVFFSATSAASTLLTAKIHQIKRGEMTVGEAISAMLTNAILPMAFGAFIRAVFDGPWDDEDDTDRAYRSAVKEVVTYPFSGLPLARDVFDYFATLSINEAFGVSNYRQRTVVDMPAARAASDLLGDKGIAGAVSATMDGNFDRATYKAANTVANAFGLPVIHVYQRTLKQLDKWGIDKETVKQYDLEEITKDKKKEKRK